MKSSNISPLNFFFFHLAIIDCSLFNVNFQINIKSTKILWDLDCGCNELADKFKKNLFYLYKKCGLFLYLFIHWYFYLTSNILHIWGLPGASAVKNPHEMQETQVLSLSWDDPLEEELATHSSILASKISWTEQPGEIESIELQRVRHNWVTEHTCTFWIFSYISINIKYLQMVLYIVQCFGIF